MSVSEPASFPLVGLQAVANAQNQWVALALRLPRDAGAGAGATVPALMALFASTDVFAALAPLDCIVALDDPLSLTTAALAVLPARHIIFQFPASVCLDPQARRACRQLGGDGYRLLFDAVAGMNLPDCDASALTFDCSEAIPPLPHLAGLPGPHLARRIGSGERLAECRAAGFTWFAGNYALQVAKQAAPDDGSSRKRLLSLLALLARDADSQEIELLLKQDPALSYHLLRLVNSAAFALSTPIHNFGQAITLLGRRQLQRWLQLLLYARQQADSPSNALLPLAAVRGAQMEAICQLRGGDRDQQDLAFLTGVFSLLDILLRMPMDDVVGMLHLDAAVGAALRQRSGALGAMLALTERPLVAESELCAVGIDAEAYWRSLLQAYQWAIHVSRNL